MTRERRWALLAHSPALVVLWANALYVRNHFYARGPFLLDAGWFSATVWRAGILPANPPTGMPGVPYYWGVHPSILVSVGSLLSYLFPGDRVDWYCLFTALLFVPLTFAVPMLVPREDRRSIGHALAVAACSLALAFGGCVISNTGYPHIEIFASSGLVIMLAALATGRERAAWIGIAMAIATREDGGFHAATFLFAVIACDVFGRPFAVARRRVIVMAAVSMAASFLLVLSQKLWFKEMNGFQNLYTGKPAYAHLTWALLSERLAFFGTHSGQIWMPALGTALIAVVRRDARYLLGWIVTLPWLLLNLTAVQVHKGELSVYVVFPFVASIFWVGAYALVAERAKPTARPIEMRSVALLSAASALGLYLGYPAAMVGILHDSFVPAETNPKDLRAFARELRARKFGRVRTDIHVTSWAIEAVDVPDLVTPAEEKTGIREGDAYAFFLHDHLLPVVSRSAFEDCGHVARTRFWFCTRRGGAMPEMLVRGSPIFERLVLNPEHPVRRDDQNRIHVPKGPSGIRIFGPNVTLPAGKYEASWRFTVEDCADDAPEPLMKVDVAHGPKGTIVASEDGTHGDTAITLPFEVKADDEKDAWELRAWSGSCGYVLSDVTLRSSRSSGEAPSP